MNFLSPLEFGRQLRDTLAASAHALAFQIDARKAALPRLKPILDGDEIGTELDELFGAIWAMALGLWLGLPLESFANVRAFQVLNSISVEGLWAWALLAYAAWRFDAILMNRARCRHRATLLGVTLWSTLAVFLMLGNIASPGGILFLVMTFIETFSYRNQAVSNE